MYVFINNVIDKIINPLIVLMFAVATLIFIWGVYDLYIAKGGEEDRKAGSQHVIYGVIGMSIMVSVFALMRFAVNTLSAFLHTNINLPPPLQ